MEDKSYAMEVLMIIAVFVGPILAVLVSQFNDRRRQTRAGKEAVFKTLMKTRSFALSGPHVEALNMIDVEFYGNDKKNKAVVEAWKLYLDNLGNPTSDSDAIFEKRKDLFIDLLFTMADALDYDFDKTHIKNAHYIPKFFTDNDEEQLTIRKGILSIINGETSLPISITDVPTKQEQVQQ